MLTALAFIGASVMLGGVASFLEHPLSRQLDAFRLGAALRLGTLILAASALMAARGPVAPSLNAGLAGLGIGLILGIGSVFYCLALSGMAPWLAASVANGYIAVTILLGVAVLGETLTWLTITGLALTFAGIVALSWRKPDAADSEGLRRSLAAIWPLGPYILLVGVGVFLEKPALRGVTALQLNTLTSLGMAIVAVAAVMVRDRRLPTGPAALRGGGVGLLFGLSALGYYLGLEYLPVSVAATLSNTSVLVTVVLAIAFRHQAITRRQVAGAVATLAGVSLLTLHQS
jgi:drug/metabolite transporter (DMT)-like permease